MPGVYPSQEALQSVFAQPAQKNGRQPFMAWSAVDDVKQKADQTKQAAKHGYEKMSSRAQAKTGKIEMFTPKYYAACTFGGLLACVSRMLLLMPSEHSK